MHKLGHCHHCPSRLLMPARWQDGITRRAEAKFMKAEFCYVVFNLDLEMRYIFTGSSGIQDEVKQWSKFLELRWPVSSDHCTADPEILHFVDGYRCHIHITLIYTLNKPGFWPHQCHYTVPGAGKRLLYLEMSKWIHICIQYAFRW